MNVIIQLDLDEFAEAIQLEKYVPKERCSQYLIWQLQQFLCNRKPELNPSRVLSAIQELEGGKDSGTKPATEFKRPPLKGLWHKHYKEPGEASVRINIRNSIAKAGFFEPELFDDTADLRAIVDTSVKSAFDKGYNQRQRDRKYTGEWLIYVIHQGKNYYLCLASHNGDDSKIRAEIDEHCVPQFPFLTSIMTKTIKKK